MSFLAQIARAARDVAQIDALAPIETATPADGKPAASRFEAVLNHPKLAEKPALRDLALQAAEREPASVTADEIVARIVAGFGSGTIAPRASNLRADALHAAAQGDDPLGAVDPMGRPASDGSWSRIIATLPTNADAIASGGPAPAHPSANMETQYANPQ
jgi:hypothetical protein